MPRVFLNKDVIFKKAKYSCAYNTATGFYFWPDENFLKYLMTLRRGREIASIAWEYERYIPELLLNRFLLLEGEDPGYEDFFPTRTFYTVYYTGDESTDVAVDRVGQFDSMDFEVLTLTGGEETLWHSCDGENTLRQISDELDPGFVHKRLRKWASLDFQIARLLPQPLQSYRSIPAPLINPAPFIPRIKISPRSQAEDVRRYHLAIGDGFKQFESVESTLSHIYRAPGPALNGMSYGEALFSKILELRRVKKGCRILEVGGGHGDVSKDILLKSKGTLYVIYDLSPELIRSQRKLHAEAKVKTQHIHGDAEKIAIKDASIDIVLSNEVIADLSTPEISEKDLKELFEKYEIPYTEKFSATLSKAPRRFRLNAGALRLIKDVERVLKPGGIAIITEFGFEDALPYVVRHLDHAEYTIHFGQLAVVAQALGLKTKLTDAFKFLNFNTDAQLITNSSFQAAYRILEKLGIHLPNLAYNEELFHEQLGEKASSFNNIQYVKISKDPIEIVKVLICEKEA